MADIQNLKGRKFGRYTVINYAGKGKDKKHTWLCQCDCGNRRKVRDRYLLKGTSKSCGCLSAYNTGKRSFKHGHALNRKNRTKEYRTWAHILGRCNNKTDAAYRFYGGRGIKVEKRWNKFENFIKDMGNSPSPKHSIDRIDNNGNYTVKNCRWATPAEQSRNTRRNVFIEGLCFTDACKKRGVNPDAVYMRVKRGVPLTHALTMNATQYKSMLKSAGEK